VKYRYAVITVINLMTIFRPAMRHKLKNLLLFLSCIFATAGIYAKNITFYSVNIRIAPKAYGPGELDLTNHGPAIFNITDSFFCYWFINEPDLHIYAISGMDTGKTKTTYTAHHKDTTIAIHFEPKIARFSIDFLEAGLTMDGYFSSIPLEHAEYIKAIRLKGWNTDSLYQELFTTIPAIKIEK